MGREGNDPIALHSSIALLQERFRQLQRVKEMREERELQMKNLGDQSRFNPTIHRYHSSRLSSHPDQLSLPTPTPSPSPTPPPPEVTLSLWPSLQIKHSNFQGDDDNPLLKNLQRRNELYRRSSLNKFHEPECDSDVDTSLHL